MLEKLMEKLRRNIIWLVIASEVSHLFCCVLPTLAAVLSLAVGVGMLPTALAGLHEIIHGYEVPVIIFSAIMLLLGWGAYRMAIKTDCHALGHDEHTCHRTSDRSKIYLLIGTGLFFVNLTIYLALHIPLNRLTANAEPSVVTENVSDHSDHQH